MALNIDESAVKRIKYLLTTEPAGIKFRVAVDGGGCAGFQYDFQLIDDFDPSNDILLEKDGAFVIIDKISLELLKNSTLFFDESLEASMFKIDNKDASSRCGCGNSFSM